MLKKHKDLLEYLQRNAGLFTTSTQLAQRLQISKRSVKSYVKEINSTYKKSFILSTPKGYQINPAYKEWIGAASNEVPQTYSQRSAFILKKLLLDQECIRIEDFCETLFIGESTLKTTLVKMNKAYANFHIRFLTKGDTVTIDASEKDKRHLISNCIFQETGNSMLSMSLLRNYFPFFEAEEIMHHILTIFDSYNYYIDDFSLMNLMLHILININRIIDGNHLHCEFHPVIENRTDGTLIERICRYLEGEFHILLNAHERAEIEILISASSLIKDENQQNFIATPFMLLSKKICRKVEAQYSIQLCTDSFILPFALHLKKLSVRLQKNISIKNPLCEDIKKNCPFIYDIAIYTAIQIQQHFAMNEMLCEEEITYIALHIGAEMERQKAAIPKLKCVLVCPSYMDYQTKIYHQLQRKFHDDILLLAPCTDESMLKNQQLDIIFTTVPLHDKHADCVVIQIPFIGIPDQKAIASKIDDVKRRHRYNLLKRYFDHFFFERFYHTSQAPSTKEAVLSFLLDELKEEGFIEDEFIQALHERENACPTCFQNFAIPHSIKMNAERSCISVYVSRKGIAWSTQNIHIVFLIGINKADRLIFKDVYESLIHLLNDEKYRKAIIACHSFHDFRNTICNSSELI